MKVGITLLSCLGFLAAQGFAKQDYTGYKVIRVEVKTEEDRKGLADYGEAENLDFWQGPSIHIPNDILVSPEQFEKLTDYLDSRSLKWSIQTDNLQERIDEEERSNKVVKMMKKFRSRDSDSVVGYYARHSEINKWLYKLARENSLCKVENIGKSYEGRDMLVLKISTGKNRPIVFLDAGIHAREWLAPATLTYVIDKLLKNYKNGEPQAVDLLNKYDFYFLPVVNPDGYDYSFLSSRTRLWRKTRKPYGRCYGADPNRNFDSHFGEAGISRNPCNDLYCGPRAFSEPETQHFSYYMLRLKYRVKLYFATHSYSQLWFIPYGYARRFPDDVDELLRVAKIGNQALFNVNQIRFELGSPPQLLYAASGGAYDWVKQLGVKYSYTFELQPGRNRGAAGFIAPVSLIKPSGEEIYAGVMASAKAIRV